MVRRYAHSKPGHRRVRATGIIIATAAAVFAGPARAEDPLLQGGLKPGPNAVGYRSLYRLDHTREYDPEYPTDPAKLPTQKPRPIFIAVWYPARKTEAKWMEYRQYLDAASDDPRIAPFAKRLELLPTDESAGHWREH